MQIEEKDDCYNRGGIAGAVVLLGYLSPELLVVKLFNKGVFIGPVWFGYVFIFICYIKSEGVLERISAGWSFACFLLAYALMYAVESMTQGHGIRNVYSPVCFMAALFFFNIFEQRQLDFNRTVNRIAKLTFGAYLLQSHMIFSEYLWERWFRLTHISEQGAEYIVLALIVIPVIFLMTACVETIYTKFVSVTWIRNLNARIEKLSDSLYRRVEAVFCLCAHNK